MCNFKLSLDTLPHTNIIQDTYIKECYVVDGGGGSSDGGDVVHTQKLSFTYCRKTYRSI